MSKGKFKAAFREISYANLVKFVKMSREIGVRETFRRASSYLNSMNEQAGLPQYSLERADLSKYMEKYGDMELEKGISYPSSDNPIVSIIIPVYNNFKLTYACIRSLIDSDLCFSTELIVADDCSTDETLSLSDYFSGVRIARTEGNYGFLKNCNNASKIAKGRYLFLLNNDTIVLKDWLAPLVRLIGSSDDVGLVGSKLLYPDGSLQEAGGILWSDGSAWNYGNGQSPFLSEFNYVHEADYISGAAIMVRRDLFEKLGGFDERYAPAYCEDSDLAFSLRKLGYKVMLQPFSQIIHFEGMSNGKRVDSGLKQYQVVNTKKFYKKWKKELAAHAVRGEDLFNARDRSFGKTTIFFIDDMVPKYDDNAGHRTVYSYLRTLAKMGYNVKFLPDNFYYDPKYTPVYQEMGIEVLYGVKYRDTWRQWLKDNGPHIDIVMLYRPELAAKYLSEIRECTRAKVYYNVADLHYLRKRREYEVTGSISALKESNELKTEEFGYMRESDYAVTVSYDEARIIDGELGPGKAKIFPIFCYDEADSGPRDYEDNRDLMFVGGFSHPPNGDAVRWFMKDIFPAVQSKVPNIKFHIVGSKVPQDIEKMASESVILEGSITDERLNELYHKVAVCVVPLRYGAGVKGKVVEALYQKVPLVSTSIGLEGLEGIGEYVKPFDDPEGFAKEVVRLCTDRISARNESERHTEYIRRYFTTDRLEHLFLNEFGPPNKV